MPSDLFVNCTLATYTPTPGSLITLTRVSSVAIDKGATSIKYSGDGDRFPTANECYEEDPSVSFQGGNIVQYVGLSAGQKGTLVFKVGDSRNRTGAGSVTWTLINAMPVGASAQVQHKQYATGTLNFESSSTDGITNPLSYQVAA